MAYSTDMLAWWKAENNALDATENGNDGTLYNGVIYTSGKVGTCFRNPTGGNNAYVEFTDLGVFTNPFSFEFWFKADSLSGPFYILNQSNPAGSPYRVAIEHLNTDLVVFGIFNGSIVTRGAAGVLSVNTWHHVAYTLSETSSGNMDWKVYLDGSPVVEETVSAPFGGSGDSEPIILFNDAAGGSLSNSFQGSIDELSFWNRVLSPTEVLAIYNSGSAGKEVLSFANPDYTNSPNLKIPMRPNVALNSGIIRKSFDPFTSMEINDNRGVITDTIPALASGKKVLSKIKYKKSGIIE